METGRQPYPSLGFTDLLVGRFGSDVGGPWWLGALLVVLAVLALIPRATRIPVLVAWLVAAVAALTATALSFVPLPLPGGSVRPGIAVMLVVLHGCFVLAAMLGAQGLVTILRRSRAEHHQVLLAVPGRRRGDHPRRSGSAGSSGRDRATWPAARTPASRRT